MDMSWFCWRPYFCSRIQSHNCLSFQDIVRLHTNKGKKTHTLLNYSLHTVSCPMDRSRTQFHFQGFAHVARYSVMPPKLWLCNGWCCYWCYDCRVCASSTVCFSKYFKWEMPELNDFLSNSEHLLLVISSLSLGPQWLLEESSAVF